MIRLLLNSASLSLVAIWRNRTRSVLTILGILIGVASVVLVTALSTAASDLVGGQLDRFGTNALFVFPNFNQQSGRKANPRLTEYDARAIQRDSVSVAAIAPLLTAQVQLVVGNHNTSTTVVGTRLPYFGIRKFVIRRGAVWTEQDEILKTRVCVLASLVAERLFGEDDPIGQTVRIRNFPYRVVGVLEPKGGEDEDNRAMIPIGSFRGRVSATSPGRADMFLVSATSPETTDRAQEQISRVLRGRHGIPVGGLDDFVVRSMADFRRVEEGIATALSLLLLGVAAISLLVGGVGVMNIMLVSVSERTREIGIRMSLGARENEILLQFLVEAITLSMIGGLLGMITGFGAAFGIGYALDWRVTPNATALIVAVMTSAIIGIIFGFLPARRAARLDPIDALRTD